MTAPPPGPVAALDPATMMLAVQVDDLEAARIAMQHRYQLLTRPPEMRDKDGRSRGLGLPPGHPSVSSFAETLDGRDAHVWAEGPDGRQLRLTVHHGGLRSLEKRAVAQLQKAVRESVWWPWLQTAPGVGEKTLARLLAATGDPRWHYPQARTRTLSELRAYCGLDVRDGQAPRRRRGEVSNWSDGARMRLWNIAVPCMKQPDGTRYRDVYTLARLRYADAVHDTMCPRCGPKGRPAPAGSPISDGHRHARGLRAVMKAVLLDVWLEARRLHGENVTAAPPAPGLRPAA